MSMRAATLLLLSVAVAVAMAPGAWASGAQCSYTAASTNSSYVATDSSCTSFNVTFQKAAYNASFTCAGSQLDNASTLTFESGSFATVYNCSLNGASIVMHNGSNARLIGSTNSSFVPKFIGTNSSIDVGYYLDLNVFEPFNHSSIDAFGERVAGFGYVIPLMNNSVKLNNTQLQMELSDGQEINNTISNLSRIVPFGVYNQSESEVYNNALYGPGAPLSYGTIVGTRRFIVPAYTLTGNGTRSYNPYAVEYSFLAYDQLVMFKVNVTRNMNITPIYIEPLFPRFNFNNIPDNGKRNMTIWYLLAIPPQDAAWNFTSWVYRYNSNYRFTPNPLNTSIGDVAALWDIFDFPSSTPTHDLQNGTRIYILNYSTDIGLGLNSSIMLLNGVIPNVGSFIEDSTTPSFSFGLSYCSSVWNQSYPYTYVNHAGSYTMASDLMPLQAPAVPILVNSRCGVGLYLNGTDMAINCNGHTINDSREGIIINGSQRILISNCRIVGNGFNITNSSNVNVYNTSITPGIGASAYGIKVGGSSNIAFYNVTIANGYDNAFSSKGSRFVNFFNGTGISQGPDLPTAPYLGSKRLNTAIFILTSGLIIIAYAYLALMNRISKRAKHGRSRRRRG
ncbi:MAG: right-handed parallel beta-helix repeat-containing protein [Candidatus Micrarchaeota archaeon]|nr:right-handed parallel beta-helix repeat-containing protein [Candidatus Micrarchaeota archaeon]MDE1851983.1 right-handed parallel beta-helix repeat-containing protein [Candidatus Micrarchaeota archaeon]